MKALDINTKTTHYLNWLTYAYMSKEGKCGFGEFLANKFNLPGEIELLESPNDTDYSYTVDGNISNEEEQETEDNLKSGAIENYYLGNVLDLCVKRGWLPAGAYVVTMSW